MIRGRISIFAMDCTKFGDTKVFKISVMLTASFPATLSGTCSTVISTATPGSMMLTITNPIPTAMQVVNMKYMSAINPVFPTFRTSPKPAIPTIIEEMIKGTTSIFKASRNISPIHSTANMELPYIHPEKIPRTMPATIRYKSLLCFIANHLKKNKNSAKHINRVYNTNVAATLQITLSTLRILF